MAIAGRIDPARARGERAQRRQLHLETTGDLASGAANVTVHNISTGGMLLESRQVLAIGERFAVDLPEVGAVEAEVVWISGALHGCRFAEPLSRAALSAAQLRAAVAPQSETGDAALALNDAGPITMPAGSLGRRIAAARRARHLSLAQVAAALAVSRPTVWAWEQDRARPAAGRVAALAEVLGITPEALTAEAETGTVRLAVEQARKQVAAAAGTSPDAVRIFIEL